MKIAIASGKGGTGKTTLAVNLARYASEASEVLLADLDVEEPNSGIFIKGELIHDRMITRMVPTWQENKCNLCGKCAVWCRFQAVLKLGAEIVIMPELCHSCYACSDLCPEGALPMEALPLGELKHYQSDNLHFVESRLNIGVEQAVPLISKTIGYLRENFQSIDLEFWDCPPGTSCSVMTAVADADFVILVTEPTPFGLYDLRLAVETMEQLGKPVAVVINRYGIGNDDVFEYCQEKEIPIWGIIPNQRSIAEMYAMGELIYPHVSEFRSELKKIIERIGSFKQAICVK